MKDLQNGPSVMLDKTTCDICDLVLYNGNIVHFMLLFLSFPALWSGQNVVLYSFCKNRIWEKESGIPAFTIASTMEAVSDFRIFLWLTDKTLFPKHC